MHDLPTSGRAKCPMIFPACLAAEVPAKRREDMHPRSFVAGGFITAFVLLGAGLYFSGNLTTDLPEKLIDTARKNLPFSEPPSPLPVSPLSGTPVPTAGEAVAHIRPRMELTVQNATQVQTPYGVVRVAAGTRVIVVREEGGGVRARFAGQELVLPRSVFGVLPAPPAPPLLARAAVNPPLPSPPPALPAAIPPAPVAAVAAIPPAAPPPPPLPLPGVTPAAATPVPSQTASADAVARSNAGVSHYAKWLLIAEGEEGLGSASVIMFRGAPTIVTNAHVMSGNPNVKFRSLNSTTVRYSDLSLSQDYDLAALKQGDLPDGIPMLEDVDKSAAIGDDVVVLGNSQGSSVVTEIPGKINGIGPDLIEVDAKFVEGNSGSPIIHVKTGKVIAIATFATLRKLSALGKDSQFTEVRRFGYRLDTATRWERPVLAHFATEAETLRQLRKTTDALHSLAVDIFNNGAVTLGIHQQSDNPLRIPTNQYLQVVDSRTKLSPSDFYEAKQRYLRSALSVASTDIQHLDASQFCAYHRRKVDEEREVRKFLAKKFTELLDAQDAGKRIRLP